MEENRNELMNLENTEEDIDEEEYEEEAESGGISWGTLIAGLGIGALSAVGIRKGIAWWRKRKTPYVEVISMPQEEETMDEESETDESEK